MIVAEPMKQILPRLTYSHFFLILECPTGWWFLKGNCYLFKKVDKRNAKLIQDCTDEESCANPDSEGNLADLKARIISKFKSKLALLSTTTQSPSSKPNSDTEISTAETEGVAK